ncbi:MAG: hypothetical protein BLM47_04980 [Candidatus Reconcilbacillus cellulovorans]|uniref:DUF2619 domain-containing protein n=1 Tax=Candidatus Reconcilbacillus cellulovorans TaxID=1906605 RepID=A0A2A6E1F0_9BACL|nr:MAG: hypothetical protein BLM47_04980 [Candidatus Reconcilbacillus cellulovorans]
MVDRFVFAMAALRMLSGCLELTAAFIMIRFNRVEQALLVNSALAAVGPVVLIATTAVGLAGVAGKLPMSKFLWIAVGVLCVLTGVLKK